MTPEEEKAISEGVRNSVRQLKVVQGLLKGDKLCDHPYLTGYGNNFDGLYTIAFCANCCLQGPKSKNYNEALIAFWKKEAIERNQLLEIMKGIKSMSTEDYKRGVEDATDTKLWVGAGLKPGGEPVAEILAEIRKKLLTKKVTKWVNLWLRSGHVDTGQTALYDGESEAKKVVLSLERPNYLGTFPIEIELPL